MKLNELVKTSNIVAYGFQAFKGLSDVCNKSSDNKVIISTLSPAIMAEMGIVKYYAPVLQRGIVFNTTQEVIDANLNIDLITVFVDKKDNTVYTNTIIVSRHRGTIEILKSLYPYAKVLSGDVSQADIEGAFVVGTLPPHLIQYCRAYKAAIIKNFDYSRDGDLKGQELKDRLIISLPIFVECDNGDSNSNDDDDDDCDDDFFYDDDCDDEDPYVFWCAAVICNNITAAQKEEIKNEMEKVIRAEIPDQIVYIGKNLTKFFCTIDEISQDDSTDCMSDALHNILTKMGISHDIIKSKEDLDSKNIFLLQNVINCEVYMHPCQNYVYDCFTYDFYLSLCKIYNYLNTNNWAKEVESFVTGFNGDSDRAIDIKKYVKCVDTSKLYIVKRYNNIFTSSGYKKIDISDAEAKAIASETLD